MEPDSKEAAEALDAIAEQRHQVARRAASPRWYYPVLGAAVALITLSLAMDSVLGTAMIALGLVLIVAAVVGYQQRTGTWSIASLRDRGAWIAWLMIVAVIAAFAVAALLHSLWVTVGCAVAAFLVVALIGPFWDAAWVRGRRGQP